MELQTKIYGSEANWHKIKDERQKAKNKIQNSQKSSNQMKPVIGFRKNLHQLDSQTIIPEQTKPQKGPVELVLESYPQLSEAHLQQMLTCLTLPSGLDVTEHSIAGLEKVKALIKNKILRPLCRPDIHKGLYRPTNGILLFGPPGTGKTTLAKWIATESAAAFFNVTPANLTSKFYGETESLVKTLFCAARVLAPSIIFFDEVDSILSKRTDKEEESTTRMKNQLLQFMDGFTNDEKKTVIVIGATNRPNCLDEAALRRLSKRIYIPLPDHFSIAAQIKTILSDHAEQMNLTNDVELSWVDSYAKNLSGYNGSDIRSLCIKAAELVYQTYLASYMV
ncbi:fidgetin-like protein 1 [Dermatophagoides farinae]|uniref:fidgetin-like protein 1 n=1 Tax=Dermatophagoides farinae TaxID=6954 RepID=UPI003F61745F